jgi:hypothetical protein
MMEERIQDLLTEAWKILKKPVISEQIDTLHQQTLEEKCVILLKAYSKCAEMRYFEGVYRATLPMFTWFAERQIKRWGLSINVETLTNRFYRLICEKTLSPDPAPIDDNFFEWCYLVIENLVSAEAQCAEVEDKDPTFDIEFFCPSTSEAWMRGASLGEDERIHERIVEILVAGDADLSPLEKEVFHLYYRKGMSIETLSPEVGLSEDRARALLCIIRSKVLHEVFLKEGGRLWKESGEEEPQ